MSGTEDYVIVNTPPFAESVTEGDIRWDKGTHPREKKCDFHVKKFSL